MLPQGVASLTAWLSAIGTLAALLLASRGGIRGLRKLGWRPAVALLLLILLAAALRWLLPAYQRIYTDEAYYMLVGSDMASHFGWVAPGSGYEKSFGWPALLGLAYLVGPRTPDVAITTCGVLGVATIPLIFAAAVAWWGRRGQAPGLWAGFLLATSPVHALWSNTAEANVPGGFTVAALLLAAGLWQRGRRDLGTKIFVVGTAALACSTRPEALPLVAVLAAARLNDRRELLWLLGGGCLIALPNLIEYAEIALDTHLPRLEEVGWGRAALDPWRAFVTAPLQPAIAALAALGCVMAWRDARGWAVAVAGWLLGTLAFLSLSGAGEGAADRFLAVADAPAVLLGGLAIDRGLAYLRGRKPVPAALAALLLCGAVAGLSAPGYAEFLRPHSSYQLQHALPEELERTVPPACRLVANLPEMYRATTELEVLDAEDVLAGQSLSADCAWFVWDLTCFEWNDPTFRQRCEALAARAAQEPVAVFPAPGPSPPGPPREARLLRLVR